MDDLQARFNSDPEAVAIAHRAPSYSQILDAKAAHTIAIAKVVRNKAAAKRQLTGSPSDTIWRRIMPVQFPSFRR